MTNIRFCERISSKKDDLASLSLHCVLKNHFLESKDLMSNNHNHKHQHGPNHVFKVFLTYFVVFGTCLAFLGLIGDDSLPGSGFFLWLLVAITFLISICATTTHVQSGQRSKVDEVAEKF